VLRMRAVAKPVESSVGLTHRHQAPPASQGPASETPPTLPARPHGPSASGERAHRGPTLQYMGVLTDGAALAALIISTYTFGESTWKKRKADVRVYLRRVKDENILNGHPTASTRYVIEVENRGPAIARDTKVTFLHFVDGSRDPAGQSSGIQALEGVCGCCIDEPIPEIQPGQNIYMRVIIGERVVPDMEVELAWGERWRKRRTVRRFLYPTDA
jgi:hypothetical protein